MEAADAYARPTGRLRIHATPALGQYYVAPALALYRERYPDVSIDLTLGQNDPDLIEGHFDVAVQMTIGELPDSGLVAQRLGTSYSILCASPRYVEERGAPQTIDALREHMCAQVVTPFFPADRWTFDCPDGTVEYRMAQQCFRVNNAEALGAALQGGIGIGALPAESALAALRNGSLVRVLPDFQLQKVTLNALYLSRQYLDAKIRTWVELLRDAAAVRITANEAELQELAARHSGAVA
jgi:DNA-binding transcriptional LysR family regulator